LDFVVTTLFLLLQSFHVSNLIFSANTEASETPPVPGSSGEESTAANSGLGPEIPEGVDPSFLAALPDEMREEVIAEHLRYGIVSTVNPPFKSLILSWFLTHFLY
jgi:hypothetical protein